MSRVRAASRPIALPVDNPTVGSLLNDPTLSGLYLFDKQERAVLEDSSNNPTGKPGTITGTTYLGNSLLFSGGDVNFGDNFDLPNVTTKISIFVLALHNNLGSLDVLLDKQDGVDTGYRINKFGADTFRFDVYANSVLQVTTVSAAITDNNWHTVCATYDGGSNRSGMSLYVDKVKTTGAAQAMANNTANAVDFTLGEITGGGSNWEGQVGLLAIWVGKELSQSEVDAMHDYAMSLV